MKRNSEVKKSQSEKIPARHEQNAPTDNAHTHTRLSASPWSDLYNNLQQRKQIQNHKYNVKQHNNRTLYINHWSSFSPIPIPERGRSTIDCERQRGREAEKSSLVVIVIASPYTLLLRLFRDFFLNIRSANRVNRLHIHNSCSFGCDARNAFFPLSVIR